MNTLSLNAEKLKRIANENRNYELIGILGKLEVCAKKGEFEYVTKEAITDTTRQSLLDRGLVVIDENDFIYIKFY